MHRRRVRVEWQDQVGGGSPARFIWMGHQEDERQSSTVQFSEHGGRQAVESIGKQAGVHSFAPNAFQHLVGRQATLHHGKLTGLDQARQEVSLAL
ncbi:MAG TPA: hypothetical protein VFH48_30685 [Chloroflexota bacterium]|nr:hypothetical protein [Chloroflexota bacterium]